MEYGERLQHLVLSGLNLGTDCRIVYSGIHVHDCRTAGFQLLMLRPAQHMFIDRNCNTNSCLTLIPSVFLSTQMVQVPAKSTHVVNRFLEVWDARLIVTTAQEFSETSQLKTETQPGYPSLHPEHLQMRNIVVP